MAPAVNVKTTSVEVVDEDVAEERITMSTNRDTCVAMSIVSSSLTHQRDDYGCVS